MSSREEEILKFVDEKMKKYKMFFVGLLIPIALIYYKIFLTISLILVVIFVGYFAWEVFWKLYGVMKKWK